MSDAFSLDPENISPPVHPILPLQSFICCVVSTACNYFHFFSCQGFSPPLFHSPPQAHLPPEGSLHSHLAESCQKWNITTIADVEMLIPSLVCPDYHSACFAALGSCCTIYPPMLKPASVHTNVHYTLHIWKYSSELAVMLTIDHLSTNEPSMLSGIGGGWGCECL